MIQGDGEQVALLDVRVGRVDIIQHIGDEPVVGQGNPFGTARGAGRVHEDRGVIVPDFRSNVIRRG